MGDLGGYSSEIFVEKPHERLHCFFCRKVLNNPHQCFNGHLYCYCCIQWHLKLNNYCPACENNADVLEIVHNKAIEDIISDLQVKCSSSVCLWSGSLSSRNAHIENDCMFTTIDCTAVGCAARVPRFYLTDHLKSCIYRPSICEYCEQWYPSIDLSLHRKDCIERTIECPNSCGNSLRISKFPSHLMEECPLQEVPCPHYCQGFCVPSCCGSYLRKDSKQHERDRCSACSNVNIICCKIIASECVGEVDDRVRWIMESETSMDNNGEGNEYGNARL